MSEHPDYADALKSAALRVTRPRMAVMHAVERHPHADTEVIIDAAREQVPDISRQAVYDVLNALTDRFGIDLTDLGDRVDVEARVNAVLDS